MFCSSSCVLNTIPVCTELTKMSEVPLKQQLLIATLERGNIKILQIIMLFLRIRSSNALSIGKIFILFLILSHTKFLYRQTKKIWSIWNQYMVDTLRFKNQSDYQWFALKLGRYFKYNIAGVWPRPTSLQLFLKKITWTTDLWGHWWIMPCQERLKALWETVLSSVPVLINWRKDPKSLRETVQSNTNQINRYKMVNIWLGSNKSLGVNSRSQTKPESSLWCFCKKRQNSFWDVLIGMWNVRCRICLAVLNAGEASIGAPCPVLGSPL